MTEPISAINVGNFKNKYIKAIFTNGMTCEGKVILWGDGRSVLLDVESNSLLYIYNTKENVMLVKVMAENFEAPKADFVELKPTVEAPTEVTPYPVQPTLQLDHIETDPNLRLKKLVDLKKERDKAMRDVIANRLKTFTPTELLPPYYDSPNFKK